MVVHAQLEVLQAVPGSDVDAAGVLGRDEVGSINAVHDVCLSGDQIDQRMAVLQFRDVFADQLFETSKS